MEYTLETTIDKYEKENLRKMCINKCRYLNYRFFPDMKLGDDLKMSVEEIEEKILSTNIEYFPLWLLSMLWRYLYMDVRKFAESDTDCNYFYAIAMASHIVEANYFSKGNPFT